MIRIHLEPGIYLNVFPVEVPDDTLTMVVAPRSSFQDLRALRQSLLKAEKKVWVYADGDVVYGYGPDAASLERQGFQKKDLRLVEVPRLATRIVADGLVNALKREGYERLPRKGRWHLYHPDQFKETAWGKIRVYRGYDLRTIFWKDVAIDELVFGLVIDIVWVLRDNNNQPLNMRQIRQQYGYKATIAVGEIQGEYLPGSVKTNSAKINTEVARQRFREQILPFVQSHPEFDLPCGGRARLLPEPIRVILGGDEQ